MRLGIIGSTGHINYVMNGLRELPHVHLVGVSAGSLGESIDNLIRIVHQEGHSPTLYSNFIELLDQAKPDIVAVACYFHDHAKIAAEALRRGIHVFVEKPVATSLEDLDMLKEAYQSSGQAQLAAMFGIRYDPAFYTAWHAVKNGAVGRIRLLHAQKSYRLGKRGEHFTSRQTYGGTIPWVGSHAIDWVHWYSGERFETVYASHSTQDNGGHGELETTAMCLFTMSNEVSATVSIDYLRPTAAPTHGDDRIRITGAEGILEIRDQQVLLINGNESGVQMLPLLPKIEIFADFVRQITEGSVCLVSPEDAFYVTEACLRAVIAADEKRVIRFE
ncbi:Gfo/Idh/MocA family protein [Paenibacillus agricola]|uniref:Gfo/Idh/MocA family oxidoreductase n=1 Tax=Paenibacillus agricola TaxID=2716264 RepID=A0ABX0J1X9_9BACL|nr:Gfo/Idh/MocA family oxidoreductase [Paenibacillus agricola]NHN29826.1 Gfo/Idh/MocA family oxidoreductase [Paenibacillus agricola]